MPHRSASGHTWVLGCLWAGRRRLSATAMLRAGWQRVCVRACQCVCVVGGGGLLMPRFVQGRLQRHHSRNQPPRDTHASIFPRAPEGPRDRVIRAGRLPAG